MVLLSIGMMNHYANAQALPANPWAAGAVETYSAPAAHNTRPALPDTRQSMDSVSNNLNVLREYFSASSGQSSASTQPTQQPQPQAQNNDALMQFLQNIFSSNNSAPRANTAPQSKPSVSIPNPVADAEAAYNRYMSDLQKKIDETTRAARNSYNNAVNSAKDVVNSVRKNLLK
ncbi:MAG: hypothetical protein IKR92_03225 [Alphaproteobacteria bacterium]|nr:hypothetical protein [Alphaproteobacteria bacterium]